MIGTKLSHYTILERIGAGGMGDVYKAFDTRLDRTVALKVLAPAAVADESKRQRFIQEARAASAINHPNILTIYEIGQESGQDFIATEYIEGQTLRQKLQSGPLPLPFVIEVAVQIVKALGVAHQAGIVHRDIKPENIMIRPDGYVKVLDFGLAKLIETDIPGVSSGPRRRPLIVTETKIVVGTVRYMSPEQVQSLPIDHRADIFSIGILLYEMLTGETPFRGQKAIDIAYEIIGADPLPLAERISGAALSLQPVVTRCLEKNPDARYQDTQSLLRDLRRLHRNIDVTESDVLGASLSPIDSGRISPPPRARPSIVVIYFENLSGDPDFEWWRKALADLLALRLMANNYLDVVSSQQVADLLVQLGEAACGDIDKSLAWELARTADANYCLTGSFMALANGLTLSVHLYEVGTGRLIASISARRGGADEIFSLIDEVAPRIERELRVSRDDALPSVATMITTSIPALRAYQEGLDLFHRQEFTAAEQQLSLAITLDPQFTQAHYWQARTARWRNSADYKRHVDNALECSGRVSERERMLILLEKASAEQDNLAQLRLAEELTVQYPREKLAYFFLGEAYQWRGECERAYIIFQQALAYDSRLLLLGAQGGAGISPVFESFLDTGRFERAEQAARELIATDNGYWLARLLLGIAHYYAGNLREADATFMEAATLADESVLLPQLWSVRVRMQEGDFAGAEALVPEVGRAGSYLEQALTRLELAETMRERGRLRDWIKTLTRETAHFSREVLDSSLAPPFWRAYFFEQVGELKRAMSEYEIALAQLEGKESMSMTGAWARAHLGRLLAVCGDCERAAELAEQLKLIGRNTPHPKIERLALFLWGAIDFYQGNYESAAELLDRSIWSYYNGSSLAVRLLAQCLRQLKQYERALELLEWVQPYGTLGGCGRFCTRTQLDLEMAKTFEAAGNYLQAIDYYQRCLLAWQQSDSDFIARQEAETGLQLLLR